MIRGGVLVVAGLGLFIAGCSGATPTPFVIYVTPAPTSPAQVVSPAPATTLAPTPTPIPTPRPSPSPTIPLTMGEAQAAFQEIADNLNRAVNEAHGGFKDGRSLKALTAASCADLVNAMDEAKRAFKTTAWPVDAQRYVPAITAGLDRARETAADPVICPSENDYLFTFWLFTGLQEPGDAFRGAIGLPPRDPEFFL